MKTTILTIALGLAALPLTFAKSQTPAPAAPATTAKPAATAPATATKKHHKAKKAVKSTDKASAVTATTPAPVKK